MMKGKVVAMRASPAVLVLTFLLLASALPLPVPSASSSRILWTHTAPGPLTASPSVGDLDGDGKLEVLQPCEGQGLQALDGSGKALWYYAGPSEFVSPPLLADLNADGGPEIVLGSEDGTVLALTSDHRFLWSYRTAGAVTAAPAAADIDADGKVEVVAASTDRTVTALDSNGNRFWSFTAAAAFTAAPLLVDLYQDGDLEVVAASEDSNLYVLSGSGGLSWKVLLGSPIKASPASADLDGDGYPEIIVALLAGEVKALDNLGDVRWTFTAGGTVDTSLVVADIDLNGKNEVLFGCSDGKLYCLGPGGALAWTAAAGGAGRSPILFSAGSERRVAFPSADGSFHVLNGKGSLLWSTRVPALARGSCAAADLTGGGETLVLVPGDDRTLYCLRTGELGALEWRTFQHDPRRTGNLLSSPSGALPGSLKWARALAPPIVSSPAVGDVTGDGIRDVALQAFDGKVHLLNGSGGKPIWSFDTGQSSMASPSPLILDLNGDGTPDIAAGGMDGFLYGLRGSDGLKLWESNVGLWEASPSAADLDGDGKMEVAVGADAGEFYLVAGDRGDWDWHVALPDRVHAAAALADLEGDGRPEAVVPTDGGGLCALEGRGSLRWTTELASSGTTAPAMGDLDGDGVLDLVAGTAAGTACAFSGADGRVLWQRSLGSAVRDAPLLVDVPGGSAWDIVVAAADGSLTALSGEKGDQVWRLAAGASSSPSAADVDGDGALDLLFGTLTGLGAVSASGSTLWSFPAPSGVRSSPAIADLDGDGSLEVCFGSNDGTARAVSAGGACARWAEPWPCFRHDPGRTGNPYSLGGAFLADLELRPGSLSLAVPLPNEGEPLEVRLTVRNGGSVPAEGFSVELSDGDSPVGNSHWVPRLRAASVVEVSFNWTPEGGVHVLRAEVDPERSVNESREDNNAAVREVRVNRRPVASAGPDQRVGLGAIVIFDGSSSSDADGVVVDHRWDFGDGTSSRGLNPTHRYLAFGNFTVVLSVEDDGGAIGTDSLVVRVNSPPRITSRSPGGNVSLPENGTQRFSVEVTDPEGDEVMISWKLDGRPVGSGPDFTYTPDSRSAGNHSVAAEASDGARTDGCTWGVEVTESPSPIAAHSPSGAELQLRSGEEAEFSITLRESGPAVQWYLDGVPVQGAAGTSFRLLAGPLSEGAHLVRVVVNASGHLDWRDWSVNITAFNAPPAFTSRDPVPEKVTLPWGGRQLFTVTVSDPDSPRVFLQWYLDGSALLNETDREFLYIHGGERGPRNVTVIASDGNSTVRSAWTLRLNQDPVAVVKPSRRSAVVKEAVTFDASASHDPDGTIAGYSWDFGDGTVPGTNSSTVKHAFQKTGVFVVVLSVTDDLGGNATSRVTVVVSSARESVGLPGFGSGAGALALSLAAVLGASRYRKRHGYIQGPALRER